MPSTILVFILTFGTVELQMSRAFRCKLTLQVGTVHGPRILIGYHPAASPDCGNPMEDICTSARAL